MVAKTGLLLNSVDQASSADSSIPQYKKLDNTGFTYHGRSYGVASTIGLVDPTQSMKTADATVLNISFAENGYVSEVSCAYNDSSQLAFHELNYVATPGGIYGPMGLWTNGSLPNGEWEGFPTWGVLNSDFVTALAAVNSPAQYVYGFAAGKNYSELNRTQCEVTFKPTRFQVSVDMTAKNISVAPVTDQPQPALDIDPSRALTNVSFYGLMYLSQTLTTMYTSVLGDSFLTNIENVRAQEGHTDATSSDALTGIGEGLELLLDHFLGSSGAAQVMLLGDSKLVDAVMTVQVIQFGKPAFAYTSLGISLALVAIAALEAFRTRFWKTLPLFDCLDLKSAIIGSANGGDSRPDTVKHWEGDATDRKVGALNLRISKGRAELQFC